jgi:hypothetical protein
LNCTLAIVKPVTADALADTATLLPHTVAPGAGAVIDTAGLLFTVTLTAGDVALLFAESVATAVKLCTPLFSFVVSSAMLYGLVVTAGP